MDFKNPTPVAVNLIPVHFPRPGQFALLCIIRNNEPAKGLLAFPGGYVEEGETAQAAAARELHEEVGMKTEAHQWTLVDSKTNAKNRMLLFCEFNRALTYSEYQLITKARAHDPAEVAGFALLTEEKLNDLTDAAGNANALGFPLHVQAARDYFARVRQAKERSEKAARAILERLVDRGDIDEQTQEEVLTEVANLVLHQV